MGSPILDLKKKKLVTKYAHKIQYGHRPVFYIVLVRRPQADNLWAGPATLTQSSQSSEINRGVTCHRLDTTIVCVVDGQKHHRQT